MTNPATLKIAICTPCYGMAPWQFTRCFGHMLMTTLQASITVGGAPVRLEMETIFADSSALAYNRTMLFATAMRWGADYILCLDSDHTFPPDALLRLLRHELPVVGCNYPARKRPRKPAATRIVDGVRERVWTTEELAKAGAIEKVDGFGLGFVLIHVPVLQRLAAHEGQGVVFNMRVAPDGDGGASFCGEDTDFFDRLRAAGIDIHLDHALSWEIGHVEQRVLTMQDALAEMEQTR